MKVLWLSAGVSSFISGYLERETIEKVIYIHIDDQDEDSLRFVYDFEKVTGLKVEILQHEKYKSVRELQRKVRYINGPTGAPCTRILKKEVRKKWEVLNPGGHTYIWGFDMNEAHRCEQIEESEPYKEHCFPLVSRGLTKQDAHAMLKRLGVKRPLMYDLGYQNNNCKGCPKGGIGYWNRIRVNFPEVFKDQAVVEREIGATCLKDKNGRIYLDELDPNRGRFDDEIMEECSIFCQLNLE